MEALRVENPAREEVVACRHHSARHAVAFCTSCRNPICEGCHRAEEHGFAICAVCRRQSQELEIQNKAPDDSVEIIPLEDAKTPGGWPMRFFHTALMVMLTPHAFYPKLIASRSVFKPLVFGVVCVNFGLTMMMVWMMTFQGELLDEAIVEAIAQVPEADRAVMPPPEMFKVMMFAAVPIMATFLMTMHASMLHMLARLMGGKGNVLASLQIYCFSVAAYLLYFLPMVGGFLCFAVLIFSQLEGMRVLHKLSFGRSLLVILVPLMTSLFLGLGAV